MMTDYVLRIKVLESLGNAIENGYMLDDWEAEDIANDIHEYDAGLEDVDPARMVPIIRQWKIGRAS